eukprot:gb/GEZN01007853.1/.p1 GENE.gb/GEZN01007853.1/~~gb/GEZN01007853.1/.p1  ORF type:complete len:457 (-),score=30.16 gb/GEZN01007853.1/:123-1469(-)
MTPRSLRAVVSGKAHHAPVVFLRCDSRRGFTDDQAPRRIKVTNPVIDMDGDETTRILWRLIKEKLIHSFLDIELKYFDLSLPHRAKTKGAVVSQAAAATRSWRVAVKCPTINVCTARFNEFALSEQWPSPNNELRTLLGGTVFSQPLQIKNIPTLVKGWQRPIIVARMVLGQAVEFTSSRPTKFTLSMQQQDPYSDSTVVQKVGRLPVGGGAALAVWNSRVSVQDFAHACFRTSIVKKLSLMLSTENTERRMFDEMYKVEFDKIFEEYKSQFLDLDLSYQHRLPSDAVRFALKSKGGFVWACKNQNGNIVRSLVGQGFGSIALMHSLLLTPWLVLAEPGHGCLPRHWRQYQRTNKLYINPIGCILAWSSALRARAELDNNPELAQFANDLSAVCVETVESGVMTKDLAALIHKNPTPDHYVGTRAFLDRLATRIHEKQIAYNTTPPIS